MSLKYVLTGSAICCGFLLFCGCGEKRKSHSTHFTKADSVTETYLDLKDDMFEIWNRMITDDNQKIRAMNNLVHELKVTNHSLRDELVMYQERIDALAGARYTQESMENTNIIEEYDFASNALVTDLISLAESQTEFGYNTTLQKLVETIRTADQRVNNYREEYDRIAQQYNQFIDENRMSLREIEPDSFVEKKPLFHMVAEE